MNYNGYINTNSIVHRMNPAIKFIISIVLIVLIFIPAGFFIQIISLVLIIGIYFLSKLPIKKFCNILLSIFFMMFILFFVNWLTYKTPGVVFNFEKVNTLFNYYFPPSHETIINDPITNTTIKHLQGYMWGGSVIDSSVANQYSINVNNGFALIDLSQYTELKKKLLEGGYKIIENTHHEANKIWIFIYQTKWYALSSYAITLMLYVSTKIFLMILIVTILTATTSSVELTYALEEVLSPLRLFRMPVTVWSTAIALSIRFIPSLLDESGRIMKAQASRGLDFKNGSFKDKILSLTSFIVPLFSIAFKKADELANAMEARGYDPRKKRTKYREYKIHFYDWIVFFVLIIFLTFVGTLPLLNKGNVFYSPLGILDAIVMFGL